MEGAKSAPRYSHHRGKSPGGQKQPAQVSVNFTYRGTQLGGSIYKLLKNKWNTFPAQNNPVFTYPNGQNVFSPGAGNATDISMSNGNVITVTDGMVTNIVGCT